MRLRVRVLAACAAVAVASAACGGDSGEGSAGETATPPGGEEVECTEERVGGSVTVGTFSEPRGLDPIVASGGGVAGNIELAALFDTLMRYDPESGEFEPHVAESLEPSDDYAEWTLTLRAGLAFSNGDPLTADVVAQSVERHTSEENSTYSRNDVASNIAEITVVDPLTVRFTLTGPWTGFPFLLANKPGMITNPSAVTSAGDGFATEPPTEAGIGPYELVRFAPGEEIVMRAKDDYWDGPVCIEELRFVVPQGAETSYEAFQAGELQAAFLRDPLTVARTHDDEVEGYSNFINLGGMLLINHGAGDTSPPTADVRVRQAIAAAVDPDAINDRLFEGTAHATSAIVGESSRRDPGVDGPEVDTDRAADLVEEAMADTDWDGSVRLACLEEVANQDLCITIEAMLEAVGFDVSVDGYTVADLVRRVTIDHDFDVANWQLPVTEEGLWRALSQLYSDVPNNRSGYASEDMDAALDDLRAAATVEDENRVLATIQEIWNETVPAISYLEREERIIWADELRGIQPTADSTVFFDDAYLAN